MKRSCFVSNSSSASFVIKFVSSLDEKFVNAFLAKADIEQYAHLPWTSTWEFDTLTMMFNDYEDVVGWKAIRALSTGVLPSTRVESFHVDSDDIGDSDGNPTLEAFDFRSYPIHYMPQEPLDARDEHRVFNYEKAYFEFLEWVYANLPT